MLEFIWHARGGQGAFTAARCLGAAAALSAGAYALAFPTFGPERRGAPMRAFTKIDLTHGFVICGIVCLRINHGHYRCPVIL